MKHCIFHIPLYLDPNWISASHIRPLKMIQAFKDIGYEVDVVEGNAKERKKQISAIKNEIKNGIRYDFLYSESSTMPTLLTEKHHLPTYPLLDFSFFKYCRAKKIPIGLFYRDSYWRFDEYKKRVRLPKHAFAIQMYKYDVRKYNQLLDIIYLCSQLAIASHQPLFPDLTAKTLPPACERLEISKNIDLYKDTLRIIYVGAIGGAYYSLTNVFKAAAKLEHIDFIFCVKEHDWLQEKNNYVDYLNNKNIKVLHVSGKSLEEQYKTVHLALTPLFVNEYTKMAAPFKLFEYIGHHLPIVGSKGTSVGEFIENNDIGWTISNNVEDIISLFKAIDEDRESLVQKSKKVPLVAENNRWTDRAMQVASDLKAVKKTKRI